MTNKVYSIYGVLLTDKDLEYYQGLYPKKSCKKCWGTGICGHMIEDEKIPILCNCIEKKKGTLTCGIEWR